MIYMNTLQEYSKPYITPQKLVTDYLVAKKVYQFKGMKLILLGKSYLKLIGII